MKNFKKLTSAAISLIIVASFAFTGCTNSINTLKDTSSEKSTNTTENISGATRYDFTEMNDELIQQYPDYISVQGKADIEDDLSTDLVYKNFTEEEKKNGAIHYDGLDSLGRCQTVSGVITYKMREEGTEREREDMPNPSGWSYNGKSNNFKTQIDLMNGKSYKGYVYNRSHLIAKSLGGTETEENLVTGTRTQNVGKNDGNGGMAYTETKARDYLDSHKDAVVYYKATPVYKDNELVPRSVFVDIKTDDGVLNEHVEVFNYAKGFSIDYVTGQVTEK